MRISDWSSDVCSSDLNSVASVGGLRRMCGIVGFIGSRPAVPVLMEGLRRLEYRGYDSAAVAPLTNGSISRRRAGGKVASLQELLEREPPEGTDSDRPTLRSHTRDKVVVSTSRSRKDKNWLSA